MQVILEIQGFQKVIEIPQVTDVIYQDFLPPFNITGIFEEVQDNIPDCSIYRLTFYFTKKFVGPFPIYEYRK